MSIAPPRNATLDLAISVIGLWLASGFLWDSWAHLHVPVETFFTPYHAIFYAAMLVGAIIMSVTALRNRAQGYRGWNVLPKAYQAALVGVPIFFVGGIGDLIWHTVFGIEDRVDAVTSPTHLIIGIGVLTVTSAPILSALEARPDLRTLWSQLPLLFSLATWLEFVHLGTAYAFDPSAARMYAPADPIPYSPDYFTNTTLFLYKAGTGVAVIVLESLIVMLFAVWLATRFRLRPGAMTIFFVLGNCIIAAALTNDTPMLLTYVVMALAAGIAADTIIARSQTAPLAGKSLHIYGFVVPVVYYAAYFAVTLATGGVWFSPPLLGGALVWAGVCGLGVSFLPGPQAAQ
jgi:hypothetical protein